MREEVDELAESVAKDLNRPLSKLSEARLDFRPYERWVPMPHFKQPISEHFLQR